MDQIKPTRVTNWLEESVTILQTAIAGMLVVLLVLGVVNLGLTIGRSLLALDALRPATIISLIRSAIDIALYLFVVVELYKTIVAYVEAKSVVMAVIHAGLIAVVRQVIIFKPDDYSPTSAITITGVYVLLLTVLLLGFYVVHREIDSEGELD
ncbi:phosphate-starvation-inducible PsiE family protein [Haloarculaceae archaeon H-GB2-1]|nr:phosphate-starvation-inducible PsiE family protein [Haloarculaceae archaeon H-GB1-1]MEA5389603.1 phosphate-starvation-inducible PsiE family protein [Haloarculaceae archaeon H-GB11]MEA5410132.1 phosphate-starvation-inducible PsiE family protein [Haloarculaceae archaeon H-GB2-1]